MANRKIKRIIGTGGVGTGVFFLFDEETTLGRNESRMAWLSDAKDFCKCHIVFSYLAMNLPSDIEVIPISKVGDDANGRELLRLMKMIDMNTDFVKVSKDHPTMFSSCFQYPDKSGGNLTSSNSACASVTPEYIRKCLSMLTIDEETMVVALPEVPLESRIEMLKIGKEHGALCVASNASAEMEEFVAMGGDKLTDWLACNEDEMAAFAQVDKIEGPKEAAVAADKVLTKYPDMLLWITYGAKGGMIASKEGKLELAAASGIKVANTGGAGDASLAGLIIGYCRGLGLLDPDGAGMLGMKLGGLSVESPDSINFDARI